MIAHRTTIDIPGKGPVSAVLTTADDPAGSTATGIITAHGAGNDMHNDLIVAFADGLADAGHTTLRFNFPYREKRQKIPGRSGDPGSNLASRS